MPVGDGIVSHVVMISTKRKTDNSDFPPERLLGELLELVDGLTEELRDLQDEVTALRRKEAPEGPDALLTREEAADRLGISTRTLGDMADSGELQPVRIRGRVLYDPETLDAYIRRRAGGADK
jgi:excisionase family DNA binding protein